MRLKCIAKYCTVLCGLYHTNFTLHWVGYTTPDYSTQGALGGLYHTNQPYTGCIGWVTSHFPTCMHTLGAVVGLYHTTLPYSSLPYAGSTGWVISCMHTLGALVGWVGQCHEEPRPPSRTTFPRFAIITIFIIVIF